MAFTKRTTTRIWAVLGSSDTAKISDEEAAGSITNGDIDLMIDSIRFLCDGGGANALVTANIKHFTR